MNIINFFQCISAFLLLSPVWKAHDSYFNGGWIPLPFVNWTINGSWEDEHVKIRTDGQLNVLKVIVLKSVNYIRTHNDIMF